MMDRVDEQGKTAGHEQQIKKHNVSVPIRKDFGGSFSGSSASLPQLQTLAALSRRILGGSTVSS